MAELPLETITELARMFYAGESNTAKSANVPKLRDHLLEMHPDATIYLSISNECWTPTGPGMGVHDSFFSREAVERHTKVSHELAAEHPGMLIASSFSVEATVRQIAGESIHFPPHGILPIGSFERDFIFNVLYRSLETYTKK